MLLTLQNTIYLGAWERLAESTLYIGVWCIGNTDDFDSSIVGSNPAIPAKKVWIPLTKKSHRSLSEGLKASRDRTL